MATEDAEMSLSNEDVPVHGKESDSVDNNEHVTPPILANTKSRRKSRVISAAPFNRMIKRLTHPIQDQFQQDGTLTKRLTMHPDACVLLRQTVEQHMVELLRNAHTMTKHAKRKVVSAADIQLVLQLRESSQT